MKIQMKKSLTRVGGVIGVYCVYCHQLVWLRPANQDTGKIYSVSSCKVVILSDICETKSKKHCFTLIFSQMVGVEYILLHAQEPILYIIRKQQRQTPTHGEQYSVWLNFQWIIILRHAGESLDNVHCIYLWYHRFDITGRCGFYYARYYAMYSIWLRNKGEIELKVLQHWLTKCLLFLSSSCINVVAGNKKVSVWTFSKVWKS